MPWIYIQPGKTVKIDEYIKTELLMSKVSNPSSTSTGEDTYCSSTAAA